MFQIDIINISTLEILHTSIILCAVTSHRFVFDEKILKLRNMSLL